MVVYKKGALMMNGKIVVSVLFVVIVGIFAYYSTTLSQTSSSGANQISREAEQAIENATEIKAVTGTIVEIGNENLMLRTNDGILTIKKSDATKIYVTLDNGISSRIDENELQQNDQTTIVVGVGINNEMTALSITVLR